MNKEIKSVLYGIIIAIFIGLAASFLKTMLFTPAGDTTPAQVNIIIPDNKPKPTVTNRENTAYKPIETQDVYRDDEIININIEPLEEFSGMSAKDILDMRKEAVKSSPIFANRTNYEPNPDVFMIQDGLQWISAHQVSCYGTDNNPDIGKGKSRESLAILNPELMYYIVVPSFEFGKKGIECSKDDYALPYRAYYTKSDNTIHAHIKYKPIKDKKGYFSNIVIADANAHDLGYNYAFANNTSNIRFKVDKFTSEPITTRGYYHRGFACRLQDGCNNYSPYETGYEFYLNDLPAKLNIKLWNQRPQTVSDTADLNYEMIFE